MPTYEYACRACGEHLEAVQSFSDEPLVVCPACGGELRKVFRSVGIVFKGSGFYKTDSRPSGTSETKKASTPETTAAPATNEPKPATTTPTPAATSTTTSD